MRRNLRFYAKRLAKLENVATGIEKKDQGQPDGREDIQAQRQSYWHPG